MYIYIYKIKSDILFAFISNVFVRFVLQLNRTGGKVTSIHKIVRFWGRRRRTATLNLSKKKPSSDQKHTNNAHFVNRQVPRGKGARKVNSQISENWTDNLLNTRSFLSLYVSLSDEGPSLDLFMFRLVFQRCTQLFLHYLSLCRI